MGVCPFARAAACGFHCNVVLLSLLPFGIYACNMQHSKAPFENIVCVFSPSYCLKARDPVLNKGPTTRRGTYY